MIGKKLLNKNVLLKANPFKNTLNTLTINLGGVFLLLNNLNRND